MSIFKLMSEILSYCNRQTVVIRQISAILPLLIHGPIRIFLQKYVPSPRFSLSMYLYSKYTGHYLLLPIVFLEFRSYVLI